MAEILRSTHSISFSHGHPLSNQATSGCLVGSNCFAASGLGTKVNIVVHKSGAYCTIPRTST